MFFEILKGLLQTIENDLRHLIRKRKINLNPAVFVDPAKYAHPIPIKKIVADEKFSQKGVEFYKKKILNGEAINPIVVVKHPRKNLYAVLDGHHRYYACKELGAKYIDSALAGDYSSVVFYLTKNGYFQPSSEVTERLRSPAKQLHKNLKEFLEKLMIEENNKKQ